MLWFLKDLFSTKKNPLHFMTTEIALPLCYEFLIFLGKLEEACVSLMPACSQSEKTHLANAVAKNVKLLLAVLAPRIRVLV